MSYGFTRVWCPGCRKETLVAFSCKGAFCPSCGARRMAECAAHLVDSVIPHVPVRQWVLALPFALRFRAAYDKQVCRLIRRVFMRALLARLRRQARRQGLRDPEAGAVCFVQRFGSALNLNIHVHALVLDGVFTRSSPLDAPRFHATPALSEDQ
ncbi:MAG: transposase zinc-binding domain-containing protein, partial [Planctomycetota bacterium]